MRTSDIVTGGEVSRLLPNRHVRVALTNALKKDEWMRADEYIKGLFEEELTEKEAERIRKFGVYLLRNWNEIRRRLKEDDMPGSCTEGLVGHVLSERFSRDPLGWGDSVQGKLVMARNYRKNGGELTKEHFRKSGEVKERYSEYADRVIEEQIKGAVDFSIFESEMLIFDGAAGTQNLLHEIGVTRKTLIH